MTGEEDSVSIVVYFKMCCGAVNTSGGSVAIIFYSRIKKEEN